MRRHRLLCVPKRHYYSLKEIPRASIVIPTMRNVALRTCLDSLRAIDGDGVTFEVLVVLNDASAEIELIAADFRDAITIIRSPVNLGVSGGFNLGFGAARGEYLIQLQDDAIVEPGWLKHLVERADATPSAGAIGSLVTDEHHRVTDPGHIVWRDGITQRGILADGCEPERYSECYPIDYHGSVGTLIRREAWQSVSGLDDSYFPAYYGDVDFCFRLRERGWSILLEPKSRVIHSESKSSTSLYMSFLTQHHCKTFSARHADALAGRGVRSTDPKDLEREINRAKEQLIHATPAPPTTEELAALEARLMREPANVLRRDRDMRTLFSSWLEETIRHLESENQRLGELVRTAHEANQHLGGQLAALEKAYGDNQQWAAELEAVLLERQPSRLHRLFKPFRALLTGRRT